MSRRQERAAFSGCEVPARTVGLGRWLEPGAGGGWGRGCSRALPASLGPRDSRVGRKSWHKADTLQRTLTLPSALGFRSSPQSPRVWNLRGCTTSRRCMPGLRRTLRWSEKEKGNAPNSSGEQDLGGVVKPSKKIIVGRQVKWPSGWKSSTKLSRRDLRNLTSKTVREDKENRRCFFSSNDNCSKVSFGRYLDFTPDSSEFYLGFIFQNICSIWHERIYFMYGFIEKY